MRKNVLLLLSAFGLIISLITLAAQFTIILQPSPGISHSVAARVSAQTSFCINSPPTLNITCNSTMSQNSSYFCQINATDTQNDNVTFSSNTTVFNITPEGVINFTPGNDVVGNHSVIIVVEDESGCENNGMNGTFNFSIANINDPPYLVQNIPDRQFPPNATISAFFLTDYFADPDLDPLSFNSTIPSAFSLTVMPSSEVRITSTQCDVEELVIFTAIDPYNATATSNAVEIKIDCSQGGGSGGGGGDSGGGGGGGAFVCREEWECEEWLPCLPTNMQWRRCYDMGGCSKDKYLKQACTYQGPPPACQENWLCSEWGNCLLNNTQQRICEDLAQCGSNITKPPLTQACVYIATCNDGVQNGNETGVDCGGECAVCPLIEKPAPFDERMAPWLLILIILSILIVSGVSHYYRAQIAQLIALLGFMIRHRTYKDVLLDAATRKSYFERLLAFEQLMASAAGKQMKPQAVYGTLATLYRQYYTDALGVHSEALPEEVAAACHTLRLRPETCTMLTGSFEKLPIMEQEELEYDELFIASCIEELRTMVCLTSDYQQEELMRQQEEIAITEQMSFYDEIFARMVNAMRACQFRQFDAAKAEYMTILTKYDALAEAEKEQIYPELQWMFNTLKFQSEITGAKVVEKA